MILLVCGGRDYEDGDFAFTVLDRIHTKRCITLIIEGGALGADRVARCWAISRSVPYVSCPADWNKYGKRAGFIRNGTMLADHKPDGVCAFPGGRGTADMIRQAKLANVPVYQPVKKAMRDE
jgi:hypothetical protein